MGSRIENYSLTELHRIAVPGQVAPSLFWALPVGHWRRGELDHAWQWFTGHPSECNDFGLLLVKELYRGEADIANVNLAAVGAKLSDLVPTGAERFASSSAYRGEAPRVLVLSGGYPQPGWGVLVEWRPDVRQFEHLIRRTIAQLRDLGSTNRLIIFTEAAQSFHLWQGLRNAPARPNLSSLASEILAAEKIRSFVQEARTALQAGQHHVFGQKVNAAVQEVRRADWLNIPNSSLQPLLDEQRTLLTAASLSAVSEEALVTEIEPKLAALVAGTDPHRKTIFRNLPSDELRDALKALLYLRTSNALSENESFQVWAQRMLTEVPPTLEADLTRLSAKIEAKLVTHRGVKAQREHEHDLAMRQWRHNSKKARESFHLTVGKAMELQWQLGPKFLVAFERFCQQDGLWVRSIPWDPARMVGWKIMASERVRLDSRDLQIVARELAPDTTGLIPMDGPPTANVDGSYFTDYVHHIAMSRPGSSPRVVTRDLVARLLRPHEMIELIQLHGGQPPMAADVATLGDAVLHTFGWRQSEEVREKPLAGCIKTGRDNTVSLAENLSGNELRIVLESFCKDIVDVVVAQLGYIHADIWTAIEERIPEYRPSSMTKDWEEEVRLLTVGEAVMILAALGPLAFPMMANEIHEFCTVLRKLSDTLNRASHHREGEQPSGAALEAPTLILQLLSKAEAFVGELSWHLDVGFVYGDQPKVLSGEAWSHGSPTPRLLRVIVWSGKYPGARATLWNKTRQNPIVTDPVFIVRPRLP
jgi:hypothetical protein